MEADLILEELTFDGLLGGADELAPFENVELETTEYERISKEADDFTVGLDF